MLSDFNGERGQAIAKVGRAYEEITGRMFIRSILEDIQYYLDRGIEANLIIKAIEITAYKGLNWQYTKGILRRCLEENIYTVYVFDWGVELKHGIAQFKKDFPYHSVDENLMVLYLACNTFRQEVENIAADIEKYLAACKSGDVSEWDERWRRSGCTISAPEDE